MAIAIVQQVGGVFPATDPAQVTVSALTAGNAVIVAVVDTNDSAGTRTVDAAGDQNNSYTALIERLGDGTVPKSLYIWGKRNISGGGTTVTVNFNASMYTEIVVYEVSGLDNSASPVTGTFQGAGSSNTPFCAPSGSIDVSDAAFLVACGGLFGGSSGLAAGTNWTQDSVDTSNVMIQHRITSGAVADERGAWTTSGTARQENGVMVGLVAAAATGNPWYAYAQQ